MNFRYKVEEGKHYSRLTHVNGKRITLCRRLALLSLSRDYKPGDTIYLEVLTLELSPNSWPIDSDVKLGFYNKAGGLGAKQSFRRFFSGKSAWVDAIRIGWRFTDVLDPNRRIEYVIYGSTPNGVKTHHVSMELPWCRASLIREEPYNKVKLAIAITKPITLVNLNPYYGGALKAPGEISIALRWKTNKSAFS